MMSRPSKITNEWLQGEILDLFSEAKTASPLDHGICVQYLNLLFRTMPEEAKKAEQPPEGRQIADDLWKKDSKRKQERKP